MANCKKDGHLWNTLDKCMMCGTDRYPQPTALMVTIEEARAIREGFLGETGSLAMQRVVNAMLSRRTAEPQPAAEPSPASSADRSLSCIFCHTQCDTVADLKRHSATCAHHPAVIKCADLIANPPQEWLDAVEKTISAYLLDDHGWNVGDALFAASKVRARLAPKPVERVTIEEVELDRGDGKVDIEKRLYHNGCEVLHDDVMKYAVEGLRAKLAKEDADGMV